MTIPSPEEIRRQVETRVAEEEAAFGTGGNGPGKEDTPHRFRFIPLGELLAEPRPPRWLVRNYLEEASLACIFGASGSMKTFIAVDMCLCVASGLPWHNCEVPNSGPVFYICGEGFAGIAKRVKAWALAHGIDHDQVPFFVSSAPVEFLDVGSLSMARNSLKDLAAIHGKPRLIVVDTLARNFGPGDENSTRDMSAFVAALDSIREQFDCAVLVVHHTGLNAADRARGASAFRAAMDFEYRLDADRNQRVLTCTKSKDHEEPEDMAFEPEVVGIGWQDADTGQEVTSVVMHRVEATAHGKKEKPLKGANKIAYEALKDLCTAWNPLGKSARPVEINEWRAESYRRNISSSTEQDSKKKAFNRAVTSLRDSGHVQAEDDQYWPSCLQRDNNGTCRDKAGHCPGQSRDMRDTLPKECPDCPAGAHPGEDPREAVR